MSKKLSALEELAELGRLSDRKKTRPSRVLDELTRVERIRTASALEELRDILRDDCGGPALIRMLEHAEIGLGPKLTEVLRQGDDESREVVNDLLRDMRAAMAECVEKAANGLRRRPAKTP